MVLAECSFDNPDEIATLLSEVLTGTVTRWCWLDTTYDVARHRTAADPTRGLSRDPAFLRRSYDRITSLARERPTPTWTFNTSATPLDTIVAVIAEALLYRG